MCLEVIKSKTLLLGVWKAPDAFIRNILYCVGLYLASPYVTHDYWNEARNEASLRQDVLSMENTHWILKI